MRTDKGIESRDELSPEIKARLVNIIRNCSRPLVPIPTGELPVLPARDRKPVFKAILFDVYGTLFVSDSGDIGSEAGSVPDGLSELCSDFGISDPPELALSKFSGKIHEEHERAKSSAALPDDLRPEVRVEEIWSSLYDFKNRELAVEFSLLYECLVNPVYPMPYLGEALDAAKSAGLAMGIVSNAQVFSELLLYGY